MDWQDDPRYLPSLKSPLDAVEPGLWIGGAASRAHIAACGIDAVISVVTDGERASFAPVAVEEHAFAIDDSANWLHVDFVYIERLLDRTTALLKRLRAEGKTILVHCAAGISRSATVVLAYLMERDGLAYNTALDALTEKRYCVNPNRLFKLMLIERAHRRAAVAESPQQCDS